MNTETLIMEFLHSPGLTQADRAAIMRRLDLNEPMARCVESRVQEYLESGATYYAEVPA